MKFDVQKYLEISTIHGLFYTSKRFRFIERLFWVFALILSIACTSILIIELVVKVQNVKIVSYLSDQAVPVSEINFPAITVCPRIVPQINTLRRFGIGQSHIWYEKHTLRSYYYERKESNAEFADEIKFGAFSYMECLQQIENGTVNPKDLGIKILKRLQVIDLITKRGTFQKVNFSIPTDDFLDVLNEFEKDFLIDFFALTYKWINEFQQYVSEIITPWGLCFTFNIASSQDLMDTNSTSDDFHYINTLKEIERGNWKHLSPPQELKRIPTSKSGLWIGFQTDYLTSWDVIEDNSLGGYTVLIHDPYELPTKRSKHIRLNLNYETKIFLNPELNSIDESLDDYIPAERNCYLENEKILKFFQVYTKNNCENECLTDFMLSRCSCVEFFMIRNSTTRICSANKQNCYKKAEEDFEEQKGFCECFDPCEHLKYEYEIIEYGTADKKSTSKFNIIGGHIKYKNSVFKHQVRKQQFDKLDFLSFVGGILGLFAGFSALSFIELIYWFTIRAVIGNWKKTDTKVYPIDITAKEDSKVLKIFDSFLSYFNESSIHGFNDVFEFSRIGSVLWILFIIITMIFCSHMISTAREKVPDSRVIAYDDNLNFKEEIPFPAVTIVPEVSLDPEWLLGDFWTWAYSPPMGARFLNNETTREPFIRNLTRINFCREIYTGYYVYYKFSFIPHIFSVLKEDSQVGWFREQFSSFNGKYQPEFAEIRTSRGMGFTFNMIGADEMFNFDQISQEFNYTQNITTRSDSKSNTSLKYPIKVETGNKASFEIKLRKIPGLFMNCVKQSFIIHQPDDLPTFTSKPEFASFDSGSSIEILVTPEVIRTDPDLRRLKPAERECYFDGEKSLKFFKKYSQRNCEIECHANITIERCGCADIEHPFKDVSDVCVNITRGLLSYCHDKLQHDLLTAEIFSPESNCSCLPLCNSISYNIKYYTEHETGGNETRINVRMNMDDIVLFRRYQQFTFSDVVSYVGGLLGLFAGISMLSIVEFFYFFTIRLGVNFWRILKGD